MVPACGILCTESQAHQVDTTSTVRISRMFEVAGFSELSFNHQSSYKRFGKATPTVLNDYAIFSIVLIDFEWHLLYTVYEFSASRLDMDRTTTGGVYDEKGSQALGTTNVQGSKTQKSQSETLKKSFPTLHDCLQCVASSHPQST